MERTFVGSLRAYSTRLGRRGIVYVWVRVVWDTVSHAFAQRLRPAAGRPRRTSGTYWESVFQDIRLAARRIRKTPGFTIVVAVTAALGITLTTLAFAIINACWFRPLPHILDPQQLVFIVRESSSPGSQWMRINYQDYLEIRERSTTMEAVGAVIPEVDFIVRIGSGFEREIKGAEVSENYFQVLGRRLALGGGLALNETELPIDQVVIGHNLWQREYGGANSVLGETMQIDGRIYTIVGVAPPSSSWGMVSGTMEAGVWIPIKQERRNDGPRPRLVVVGRRHEDQTIERAQAELETISSTLAARHPDLWEDNSGRRARLLALTDLQSRLGPLHENFWPSLIFWFVLVGVTMLVTCSNVATLLLNRALRRRTEIATRLALGSGRGRLVRQLLVESILLFGIAGSLSLLLIHWQTQLLANGRSLYPFPVDVTVDPMVVFFAAALTVGSGVIFGLAPALQASRPDLLATLKGTGRLVRFRRFGVRNLLVLTQVAGSTVLIAITALTVRDIQRAYGLDVGFDTHHIGVISLDLRLRDYGYEQGARFVEDLTERCAGIAGVEAVVVAGWVPLSRDRWSWGGISPEGYEIGPNESPWAYYNSVTPGYFDFMGMPLVSGREFTDQDDTDSPRVIIVNQSFADRFWPDKDPLGKTVTLTEDQPPVEVVGLVRDAIYRNADFANERTSPHFWFPRGQSPDRVVALLFKTHGDPALLFNSVREEVRLLDNNMPIKGLERLEAVTAAALMPSRVFAGILGVLVMAVLFIAVLGVYAVTGYAVLERTRELGIRLALGARPIGVVRMVVLEGLGLSAVGIVLGSGVAILVARGMRSLLLGIGPLDPASHLGSAVFLVLAAMTASLVPALRASRVDPVLSLRSD
jgi:predicted permease